VGYYQGDYYQGDYYRGDPFNPFALIGGAVKVGKAVVKGVTSLVQKKPAIPVPLSIASPMSKPLVGTYSVPVPKGTPGAVKRPGEMGVVERFLPGGDSGYILVKRKRMNVANVKALRRALRRQKGFIKLARRALSGSGMIITRSGGGRRGGSPGRITRSEAARALRA